VHAALHERDVRVGARLDEAEVGEHAAAQVVGSAEPGVRLERRHELGRGRAHDLEVEATLAAEVVIEQALGDASGARDLVDLHVLVRPRTEERQPELDELRAARVGGEVLLALGRHAVGPQS